MRPAVAATGRPGKLPSALGAVFKRAIPVEVTDRDGSKVSARFVDAICSAPGIKVTMRSCDLYQPETAVRSGKAIAAIHIPENLERDIIRGRGPHITVFYNKQFFGARNSTSNAIRTAVSAAAALDAARLSHRVPLS